ncbi:creatininase family protein [Candidatus Omnitrophota bacterium]
MNNHNSRRKFMTSLGLSGLAAGAMSGNKAHALKDVSGMGGAGKDYINSRRVLLYECTRKEIRERIASGKLKAAIIPTGSTEQHNEHLALAMDTSAALVISQLTAMELYPKVIVTTPVPFGICPYWMNRQGTLSVREETFTGLVYDICCSMKTHGIEAILVVNGHGGNIRTLNNIIPGFSTELGIPIETCSYWDSVSRDQRKEFTESGVVPGHADEFETSFALAAFPERVRRTTYEGMEPYKWDVKKEDLDRIGFYTPGWDNLEWDKKSFELSKLATPEKGEKFIAHAVGWVADKVSGMIK